MAQHGSSSGLNIDESGVRANGGPSWKWIAGIVIAVLIMIIGGMYSGLVSSVRYNSEINSGQSNTLTRIETQYLYISRDLTELKEMVKDMSK